MRWEHEYVKPALSIFAVSYVETPERVPVAIYRILHEILLYYFKVEIDCVHMHWLPLNNFVTCSRVVGALVYRKDESVIFMHQDTFLLIDSLEDPLSVPNFKHVLHIYLQVNTIILLS